MKSEVEETLLGMVLPRMSKQEFEALIDDATREYLLSFNTHRAGADEPPDPDDPGWIEFREEHLPVVKPIVIDVIHAFILGWAKLEKINREAGRRPLQ